MTSLRPSSRRKPARRAKFTPASFALGEKLGKPSVWENRKVKEKIRLTRAFKCSSFKSSVTFAGAESKHKIKSKATGDDEEMDAFDREMEMLAQQMDDTDQTEEHRRRMVALRMRRKTSMDVGNLKGFSAGEKEEGVVAQYFHVPKRRLSMNDEDKEKKATAFIHKLRGYYFKLDCPEPESEVIDEQGRKENLGLLKRESIRFDPRILHILRDIWRLTDLNHDSKVDRDECVKLEASDVHIYSDNTLHPIRKYLTPFSFSGDKCSHFAEKVRLQLPMIGKIIKTLVFINHSSNIINCS